LLNLSEAESRGSSARASHVTRTARPCPRPFDPGGELRSPPIPYTQRPQAAGPIAAAVEPLESRLLHAAGPAHGLAVAYFDNANLSGRAVTRMDRSVSFDWKNEKAFTVNLDKLAGENAKAAWYDPRTGKSTPAGQFRSAGHRTFTPPTQVLLLK
jgi:hypothetical protein